MTEPVTTLKTLIVPNTGDLTAAWGTSALNPNFQLIDSMLGGVATISLGAATTITLSVPATTGIWASTNPQSSQAMIRTTGTQTGDAFLIFTLPGFYIIDNKCTANTSTVICFPSSGGGKFVCVPPGRKTTIFYDSLDIDYVDLGIPGAALDLHGFTSVPRWIAGCSVPPYLLKDGSSYSTATYPNLAFALAGAFGNSNPVGVSFFVPDEMARARIAYDSAGTGRLTTGVSGVNGATMGSAGGDQSMASHQHANSLNDPGHKHSGGSGIGSSFTVASAGLGPSLVIGDTGTATTGMGITNATTGSGFSQNVQPSIVSFLPLVKT